MRAVVRLGYLVWMSGTVALSNAELMMLLLLRGHCVRYRGFLVSCRLGSSSEALLVDNSSLCSLIGNMYDNVPSLLLDYLPQMNPMCSEPKETSKADIKDASIEQLVSKQLSMHPGIKR